MDGSLVVAIAAQLVSMPPSTGSVMPVM